MKWLFYCILCSAGLLASCRQSISDKTPQESAEASHDIAVYHQAIKFGDMGTAIHAMHSLIARDTTQRNYYDTLAILYYHSQNYPQAIQAAQMILEKNQDDKNMLEVAAHSYQALNRQDLAVPFYEHLAEVTKETKYVYDIADAYFKANVWDSAANYANSIIEKDKDDTGKVLIAFEQEQQMVSVIAAAYNIRGSVAFDQHKKDAAIADFNKALAIFPDFKLAQSNLQYASKKH
jgi:tetratricopeptide (TPR) repeat protein